MNVSELPHSDHIGNSMDVHAIGEMLQRAIAPLQAFTGVVAVSGSTRSGRLLFTGSHPKSVALPKTLDCYEMAFEIKALCSEARRERPLRGRHSSAGWEIRKTLVQNAPAALVWAIWL